MAKIVLQPCHVRDHKVADDRKAEPLELDWEEALELVAAEDRRSAAMKLRSAQAGAFVGVSRGKRSGRRVTFLLLSSDRSNNIKWLLQKDDTFPDRIESIYRVEEIEWEGGFEVRS